MQSYDPEIIRADRLVDPLINSSFLLSVLLGVGAILFLVTAIFVVADRARESATASVAAAMADAMTAVRNYYSENVVTTVEANGGRASHRYLEDEGSIPLPATLSIELGNSLKQRNDLQGFRLYSDYPFAGREGGPQDQFERRALEVLRTEGRASLSKIETLDSREDVLRYAVPVIMRDSCVECHNSHPDSTRTDWRVGDVRGVQSITVPMPSLASQISRTETILFGSVLLATGLALILARLMVRRLRLTLQEKEEQNNRQTDRLRHATATALAANDAKSRFLATMSHELRTPLNAIIGFSSILSQNDLVKLDDAKKREYAGDIESCGQHLLSLLNDVIDLAKIEAGESKMYFETIELPEVASEVVRLFHVKAGQAGVDLTLRLDAPVALSADERALKQILTNLLSNAIKFTPRGGKVTVASHRAKDGSLMVQVIDTGRGIPRQDLQRVLEPFGQAEQPEMAFSSRADNGTGLGLSITRSLMHLHEGDITIDSEVGRGTTVTLCFPTHRIVRSGLATWAETATEQPTRQNRPARQAG